jgi:hypothetical protein
LRAFDDDPTRRDGSAEEASVPAIYCTDGPALYRVRILSPAQWEAVPESQRPDHAEYVPGVGWVVGFPEQILN